MMGQFQLQCHEGMMSILQTCNQAVSPVSDLQLWSSEEQFRTIHQTLWADLLGHWTFC